jgi:hypothetical protein
MQSQSINSQSRDGTTLFEAQRSAMEMASKLSALALDYAVELNKTWFELAQKHIKQYANLPRRLAECRTPEEVYFAQTDIIGKATQDYKQDLTAYADMIGKATQGYKEGLDQLVSMGEGMAQETGRVLRQGQEAAQSLASQTTRSMERGQEAAEAASRSAKGSRGRSGRAEEDREERAKPSH